VSDADPGIRRKSVGRGFQYLDPRGRRVTAPKKIRWFQSLAIPPAWKRVWICPSQHGHLQAIGWDQRGRKQYRYHPLYRSARDQNKFDRIVDFARVLPKIRRRVRADLANSEMSKRKVIAAVIRLLESTAIRVGNPEYERQNGSFGLTTLRNHHVKVESGTLRFRFPAKSGQLVDATLNDSRLARIVRNCQHLPGQHLFTYLDEQGGSCKVSSEDVNEYIREASAEEFTAKDFRTWKGTVEMAAALAEIGPASSETEAKRNVVAALKSTAGKLGNRPATCRAYYVHPAVIDAYLDGSFFDVVSRKDDSKHRALPAEERAALRLIQAGKSSSV
jgi:DNA topoisomerase-1